MAKRKRLTYIEILLILAIIAILVVWLFPRFLKMLDSKPTGISRLEPPIGMLISGDQQNMAVRPLRGAFLSAPALLVVAYLERLCPSSLSNFRARDLSSKRFSGGLDIKSAYNKMIRMPVYILLYIVKNSVLSGRKVFQP